MKCLRCKATWPTSAIGQAYAPPNDTCECGFRIVVRDMIYEMKVGQGQLYWNLHRKICYLYPTGMGTNSDEVVDLPLFPFDVSMEVLRKYMVLM